MFLSCKSIQLKRIGPFCIVNEQIRKGRQILAKNEVKKSLQSRADEAGHTTTSQSQCQSQSDEIESLCVTLDSTLVIVSYSTLDLQSSSALDKGSNFPLVSRANPKQKELNIEFDPRQQKSQQTSSDIKIARILMDPISTEHSSNPLLKIDNNRND